MDPSEISFNEVLHALLDEGKTLEPVIFYRLSALGGEERKQLEDRWQDIPLDRRRTLLEDMETFAEADPLLFFEAVGRIGLSDPDSKVRLSAVRILWGEESPGLESILLNMLVNDEDMQVRAGSGSALGHYVFLGECEEIPQKTLHQIEDLLLQTVQGNDHPLVRRRALEALGFSGRPEIPALIESAFASDDDEWIATALFAMGRSANPRWKTDVLGMLENENPLVRMEAVRAAGELEIKSAASPLLMLIEDEDSDVRDAAIWSLSQIGGRGVAEALEDLLFDCEDEEEIDLIEAALDNLAFTEESQSFMLLDFEDDLDEMDDFDDD